VEEDSLGETDVENDTNNNDDDNDDDEGSSIFAVEDFDDTMTIDPVPLADYKSDVRLVSSSTVDFDLCPTGTTILCSPQTIKNVWTPMTSPVINTSKNTHRMLFDSPTISPKRMRCTFDVLPPLPLDRFDSCISLVWDSSSLLIGAEEADTEKENTDLCHTSYVSRETSSLDETIIHDPNVDGQSQLQHQLLPPLEDETDELKDDKTQAEIQQLMRATLKSLIASMRKSKESRAQVLDHLEKSPEVYASIKKDEQNDEEKTKRSCFKVSEQSGNECMDVAFSILVDTDDNDDDADSDINTQLLQ
jgi:hypothetical protein